MAEPRQADKPAPMRGGVVRKGKTWFYVIREHDPETGLRKPRWVSGFRTRKAAAAARAEAVAAQGRGTYVAPRDMLVGQWLDEWIEGHAMQLKPSTVKSYRDNIQRYLKPAVGHERLQGLAPGRLSVVFREMHEQGGKGGRPLSARTVEFARAVLRRAMQDAVIERVLSVNPVVGTKRPAVSKPEHTTWSSEQVATYLDHTQGHAMHPLAALALASGMRRGELCALRWQDVDLDTGGVRVERAVTQIDGERTYAAPKNHERRTLSIDARTAAILRALRLRQTELRLAWGAAGQHTGLLFTREDGAPLAPDSVGKIFITSQAGAGLPRLKLHEARHSHATILLRAGVPVHIVAKRLGHRDPSVTLNVYADAIPDDDTSAVDVFSRAVFGA